MIYSFSLQAVAVFIGFLLIVTHIPPILWPERSSELVRKFPRSVPLGIALMTIGVIWASALAATIDLGEFSSLRTIVFLFCVGLGGAMVFLSREYLAVRGWSVLLLLGANVILDAAILRNEPAKLVMVILAYVWIVVSIALLFSPYLLRDAIGWATKTADRFRVLSWAGIAFGTVLVFLGLFIY